MWTARRKKCVTEKDYRCLMRSLTGLYYRDIRKEKYQRAHFYLIALDKAAKELAALTNFHTDCNENYHI